MGAVFPTTRHPASLRLASYCLRQKFPAGACPGLTAFNLGDVGMRYFGVWCDTWVTPQGLLLRLWRGAAGAGVNPNPTTGIFLDHVAVTTWTPVWGWAKAGLQIFSPPPAPAPSEGPWGTPKWLYAPRLHPWGARCRDSLPRCLPAGARCVWVLGIYLHA